MDQSPQLTDSHNANIVFYDGRCRLCSGAVMFILRHEQAPVLFFAPLGGETFQNLGLGTKATPETIVFYERGHLFVQSAAILRIARYLRLPLRAAAYLGWCVPPFIRDAIYRFVAKRRYRWFGQKEHCLKPEPHWQSRFLA
ncbi:MAG: DCC1-like thiol-disulfide oxidoreductase family protein [Turneriella sp.]|nr:DCC1-like thiol-disulfide oxidoreductase family protein [Turneriella sp.]